MDEERCMECNAIINEPTYAVYSNTDEVVGFLCDVCRRKHRVKEIKKGVNKNPFEKLTNLFKTKNEG